MQLHYCEKCGFRVHERDFAEGRAVRNNEMTICGKCLGSAGIGIEIFKSPTEKTSPPRPKAPPLDSAPKSSGPGSAPRAQPSALDTRKKLVGISAGVLGCFLLVVGWLLLGQNRHEAEPASGVPEVEAQAVPPPAAPAALRRLRLRDFQPMLAGQGRGLRRLSVAVPFSSEIW